MANEILLVEDNAAIARSLKESLEDESYAVDVVHDGNEGYRIAVVDDYDVIIYAWKHCRITINY